MPRRLALLVATYRYQDGGLHQLTAPGHDAEALAEVLRRPDIANFEVTILVNEPYHVVGNAIGDFYHNRRRDDLTLLYFTGHGLKDDEGRLYLAMTNTKRDRLIFTGLSAQQIDEAMNSCSSRQNVLVLDCCYSGAFPAGHAFKADSQVHTIEEFKGKGRVVLTASDSTQYSFEGNRIIGQGTRSVFTRFLIEGLTTGEADLDGDGDISLDELYSYVYDRVIEEMPQQRPKKQENVEGRIVIARNIHWSLPASVRNALESPFARDRLAVLEGLAHLHRVGNDTVQAEVIEQTRRLIHDDSKAVSEAAMKIISVLNPELARRETEEQARRETEEPRGVPEVSLSPRRYWAKEQDKRQVVTSQASADQHTQTGAVTERQTPQRTARENEEQAQRKTNRWTAPSKYIKTNFPPRALKFGAVACLAFLCGGAIFVGIAVYDHYIHSSSGITRTPGSNQDQLLSRTWPELQTLPPSVESTLRSQGSERGTQVEFVNMRTTAVIVYWLNYQGQRVRYNSMPPGMPGMSYIQPTYITHPWVVCTVDDEAILVVQPTAEPSRVIIR